MILTTGLRPRWQPTLSPGYGASSRPRRRSSVFHYSGYEIAKISELARREHHELLDWAAGYAEEHFVDLLEIVKAHYFGVSGLGLKLMAGHVGFSWRDDDPGGLNSQLWFAEAVHGATDRGTCPGAAPRAGIQRGRRDRHQSGQSVAASAVISRSRVRRWARSITASTSSIRIAGSART